jgi:hypothetical protein
MEQKKYTTPKHFSLFGQTVHFNDFTEYGEPRAWMILSDGSSIEVCYECYNVDKPFYSIRRHCNENDFDQNKYHDTCGVMEQCVVEDMAQMTLVLELYLDLISQTDHVVATDPPIAIPLPN